MSTNPFAMQQENTPETMTEMASVKSMSIHKKALGQFCAPGYGPIAESAKQTCPFTWDSLNMFSTRAEEAKPF